MINRMLRAKGNWEEVEIDHMLAFKALPILRKFKAIEELGNIADVLIKKAALRRKRETRKKTRD